MLIEFGSLDETFATDYRPRYCGTLMQLNLLLIAQAVPQIRWDRVFLFAAAIFALASILRRKKDIGGWLFYFYYWIAAFLFAYAKDALQNMRVFAPSYRPNVVNHAALAAAVFPRFFGILAVCILAGVLLFRREPNWLERLRVALLAELFIAGSSVVLDIFYFPRSTQLNAERWAGLCLWVLYFHFAKRVQRVFGTKDPEALPTVERVMT